MSDHRNPPEIDLEGLSPYTRAKLAEDWAKIAADREATGEMDSDKLIVNTTSFPKATRFFCGDDNAIAIIGGPSSGGALVKFTGSHVVEISDEDFFKIDPDEIAEAEFREKVGADAVARPTG